jgi:hypothetical protein
MIIHKLIVIVLLLVISQNEKPYPIRVITFFSANNITTIRFNIIHLMQGAIMKAGNLVQVANY